MNNDGDALDVQCAVAIWHPGAGITPACNTTFGCCAAQQLSQTMTDGDLSSRLVAISYKLLPIGGTDNADISGARFWL